MAYILLETIFNSFLHYPNARILKIKKENLVNLCLKLVNLIYCWNSTLSFNKFILLRGNQYDFVGKKKTLQLFLINSMNYI